MDRSVVLMHADDLLYTPIKFYPCVITVAYSKYAGLKNIYAVLFNKMFSADN